MIRILGIGIDPIEVGARAGWWEEGIRTIQRNRSEALFLQDCTALDWAQVVDFAAQNRLPTMSPWSRVARP